VDVLIFQILKYASLLIGSTTGIIGTLSDTKDKKTKKLTKSGKTLISLLVISMIVAIISQSFEIRLKQIEDDKLEVQHMKDIAKLDSILDKANQVREGTDTALAKLLDVSNKQEIQLQSQKEIFLQTSRLLSPLFPLELRFEIAYPQSYEGFSDYLDRLKESHLRPQLLVFSIPVSRGSIDEPRPDGYEYPATVLTEPFIYIYIYKEGNNRLTAPDLVLYGGSDSFSADIRRTATSLTYDSDARLEYPVFFPERPITSTVTLTNPLVEKDNGEILSYMDFNNATLVIDITKSKNAGGVLSSLEFQFKSGRRIESKIKLNEKDLFEWGQNPNGEGKTYKMKLKATRSGISRAD
jgi:hypothetical protein